LDIGISRPARDDRIDFWRGLCIVGMVAWHLLTDPSYPRWFSFGIIQGFNFVAEGFVLLAGAAVGLHLARSPQQRTRPSRYLARAARLLAVHYILAAVLLFVFAAPNGCGPAAGADWLNRIGAILTLQYQPYLGDILSLFVFLLAAAPALLILQRAVGKGGLLALSLSVYLASNLLPAMLPKSLWATIELNHYGAFDFNSWQFVFVGGLLLGQSHQELLARAKQANRAWLVVATAAFLVACAYRFPVEKLDSRAVEWPAFLGFGRHPLAPPRAIYIGLQMLLVALITVRFWERLAGRWWVRTVVVFGRNSLAVFAWSVALDYLFKTILHRCRPGFPANLAIVVLDLAMLYLVARYWHWPAGGTTEDHAGQSGSNSPDSVQVSHQA
jgi:hypothetical protein